MNPHIQRILQAERAERLVPASGVLRTHNGQGVYDPLTRQWSSWFDDALKPSILPATVPQGYTEHYFSTDALKMPLKTIPILRASLINTDIQDCSPDMVEAIVRAHPRCSQWKLVNEYSTYPDLLTIVLNNWLKNKADYWHIEDEVAYGTNEDWKSLLVNIGWAHGTPMWKLVCLLMKQAMRSQLFAMELDQAADMCEENILDVAAGEQPDEHQIAARDEDWMQPWFNDVIKQLYRNRFRLKDQLKSLELPSALEEHVQALSMAMKRHASIEKRFNDYDVCLMVDSDGEWQQEIGFCQVYWGRNDSWLSDYIDEMMEMQLQSGATIVSSTIIMRIDKSGKQVTVDTTPHYHQRVKLRQAYIQCLEELKQLAEKRKMI
jgi:hypothetical protein